MTQTGQKLVRSTEASDLRGSAADSGVTETLRKYNLSSSVYRRWRGAYNGGGMTGLKPQYRTVDPELKRLQQENERLKKIMAKQALELISRMNC